jgi:hypothetical protein
MTDKVKVAAFFTAGLLIGGSTTYYLVNAKLKTKYETMAQEEIESVRTIYKRNLANAMEKEDIPDSAFEQATTHIRTKTPPTDEYLAQYNTASDESYEDVQAANTPADESEYRVQTGEVVDINIDEENRSSDHPYAIVTSEYFSEEMTFDKLSVAYYPGNGVLLDERDEVIDDIEGAIGTDNLLRFGHGSDDPSMVYVRNEKQEADYEVCLMEGSYSPKMSNWSHQIPVPVNYQKVSSRD